MRPLRLLILGLAASLPLAGILALAGIGSEFGLAGGSIVRGAARGSLEAHRRALRDSLRVQKVAWAGELEMTWKPRVQVGCPDSVGTDFVLVAILRGRRPPPGLPPELTRWTDPMEAAPPERVDRWLATRVMTTDSRRWLLARALPPTLVQALADTERQLATLGDLPPPRSPWWPLPPLLLAWPPVQVIVFAWEARRRRRARNPGGP